MDFLDPKKKRAHSIRLLIGYGLMGILIAIATIVLVYESYGYGVDTKTGAVIENGLMFVDAKPNNADLYLNGEFKKSGSSARLVLPAGQYQLALKRDGYRDWQRTVDLEGRSIERFVYPFLFPNQFSARPVVSYPSLPPLVTSSPDRRWLLVQQPYQLNQTVKIDLIDTTEPRQAAETLTVPISVIPLSTSVPIALREVEWANSNRQALLAYKDAGGVTQFVVIDRENIARSFSVNQVFNINPVEVTLRDKKADQLYIHETGGNLRVGIAATRVLGNPVLRNVIAFKGHGATLITYATNEGAQAGRSTIRIWDNGQSRNLGSVASGGIYLLDAARFDGDWYYAIGSSTEDKITIYKDPIDAPRVNGTNLPRPHISVKVPKAKKLAFSANTRFIGVTNGQQFGVYDIETDRTYSYTVDTPITGLMHWMDGHRFIGVSDSKVFVMDYDGTNKQSLLPSVMLYGARFDRDYDAIYTLAANAGGTNYSFSRASTAAGDNIPQEGR